MFVRIGFNSFGVNSYIRPCTDYLVGKRYISIGKHTSIGKHVQLTAWSSNNGCSYNPSIIIGDNCQFGAYNHITAINSIVIGNGVLTGRFVTIADNSHGANNDKYELNRSPIKRPAYSKGIVEIGDNVWVGDKATILPNVRIGEGAIIGANSVVTKDVPAYSMAAGCPARVIKNICEV